MNDRIWLVFILAAWLLASTFMLVVFFCNRWLTKIKQKPSKCALPLFVPPWKCWPPSSGPARLNKYPNVRLGQRVSVELIIDDLLTSPCPPLRGHSYICLSRLPHVFSSHKQNQRHSYSCARRRRRLLACSTALLHYLCSRHSGFSIINSNNNIIIIIIWNVALAIGAVNVMLVWT